MEVQRGDNRLRLTRASPLQEIAVTAPVVSTPLAAHAAAHTSAKPAALEPNHIIVKSPIVGTYYDAGGPGSPPFVKVGDSVEPGQVLCIIESMKLMNEIEAEVAGTIVHKLCENGRPVEYGEALFAVQPR